ncbi:MAG: hypothetical protein ACK47B_11740 [Armatimonadota bacterium]
MGDLPLTFASLGGGIALGWFYAYTQRQPKPLTGRQALRLTVCGIGVGLLSISTFYIGRLTMVALVGVLLGILLQARLWEHDEGATAQSGARSEDADAGQR